MALAVVCTRALNGVDAIPVAVEVHTGGGLPAMTIVGLPEAVVREAKDRVRGAIQNSEFRFPDGRITVNLAPADLPKEGGRYDLAIALGVLAASGQLDNSVFSGYEFVGEIALSGELRAIRGTLPTALATSRRARTLVVPHDNADEAALVEAGTTLAAGTLLEVVRHLRGESRIDCYVGQHTSAAPCNALDLCDVKGQHQARRALEVAAAGGHNILFTGPPGTGKSMLAARLDGLLPAMSETEALETAAVASVNRGFNVAEWQRRPFRAPHHTASAVALVGGGSLPRPGEISLAHNGVLFLDELAEFDRRVLEVLREPLETGRIMISRARQKTEYPARFQLVAAMNPCPCGFANDRQQACNCTPTQIARYRTRVSGPLMDRIDLQVEAFRVPAAELLRSDQAGESSATVRARVGAAREIQIQRAGKTNAWLSNREIARDCRLDRSQSRTLEQAVTRFMLSPRGYHSILKVARTIADMHGEARIPTAALAEAISYRCFDRGRL